MVGVAVGSTPSCTLLKNAMCFLARQLIASVVQLTMLFYGQAANRQSRSMWVRLGVQPEHWLFKLLKYRVVQDVRLLRILLTRSSWSSTTQATMQLVLIISNRLFWRLELIPRGLIISPCYSTSLVITPRSNADKRHLWHHIILPPPGLPLRVVNRPSLSAFSSKLH